VANVEFKKMFLFLGQIEVENSKLNFGFCCPLALESCPLKIVFEI